MLFILENSILKEFILKMEQLYDENYVIYNIIVLVFKIIEALNEWERNKVFIYYRHFTTWNHFSSH